MNIYSFEKLDVWQNSRMLVKSIYIISKTFPEAEKFGITSQLRRAMVSVVCNISEGTSRWSDKEKIRYIEIAYGSLMEVLNCIILVNDLEYINEGELISLRIKIDGISNQLNALKRSIDKRLS